jgi:hypothetical protein
MQLSAAQEIPGAARHHFSLAALDVLYFTAFQRGFWAERRLVVRYGDRSAVLMLSLGPAALVGYRKRVVVGNRQVRNREGQGSSGAIGTEH